jgi:hypothetical protein
MTRAVLLALLISIALPAVASASRPATPEEADAVAAGADGARGICATVTMSTIDGTWSLAVAKDVEGCEFDLEDDKLHVMHFADGVWTRIAMLDHPTGCPEGVPAPVASDLGFCKPQRGYMVCANKRATAIHREFDKPRTCNTLRPRQPFAQAVNLAHLKWTGWGKSVAKARGIDRGFRKKDRDTAVTVRASGRRVGCQGDWIYTELRVHSKYGTDVVYQPSICPDELESGT